MWSLLFFLAQMAFVETYLKPFLIKFTHFAVGKYVPPVLGVLDDKLPNWIVDCTEGELKDKCFEVIKEVALEMGEEPNPLQAEVILDAVVSSYSFLINASKVGEAQ